MFKRLGSKIAALYNRSSIRYMIFISFTVTALIAILLTAATFYVRFSSQLNRTIHEENRMLVKQVNQSVSSYLQNMMQLSNTIVYRVVKNEDIDDANIKAQLQLLHHANSDYVKNVAVFSADGSMLAKAPEFSLKGNADIADITSREWFTKALEQTENLHYSTPYVQNLFEEEINQYSWIITLSTYAEITRAGTVEQGVLMMNLKYGAIADLFRDVVLSNEGYIYLVDQEGTIIYHPQHQLITTGLYEELPIENIAEGEHTVSAKGDKYSVIIQSVGYTGWYVIGVIPQPGFSLVTMQNMLFVAVLLLLYFMIIIIVNAFISHKLTDPIKKLELSLQRVEMDADSEEEIFIGGSQEVRHLGRSIRSMVQQLRKLTDDIVFEQTQKQKSELNALQAQINPHFLYNTLDIIVWMIEKQQPEEALKVVSALARFFRLSLSKGKNIITVKDEMEHVRNYLMIQQMRYRNKFKYTIEAEEGTLELSTIKLVLQPIAENAIYHSMGVTMDGDEEITIRAYREDGDLYISVQDNGLGMPPEQVARLLTEQAASSIGGSGVGLKNVHERIMLYFGSDYGVMIESELDEGTCVTLHLPALPYEETEENQ